MSETMESDLVMTDKVAVMQILGDGLNAKRQLQSALGFERMFAKRLNTLDGPQKPTESRSTRQHGVAQSYGNRRVSVGDQPVKNVLLPMTPGDIYMSSSLLRLGVFHYIQVEYKALWPSSLERCLPYKCYLSTFGTLIPYLRKC